MGTLSAGGRFFKKEELDIIEQQRLQALLEIIEQHDKEITQLKYRLAVAGQKADKLGKQVKNADHELKTLKASNPNRMKKQIKRLQEQNRTLTTKNGNLKTKHKQLTQKLHASKEELEQLQAKDKDNEEQAAEKK